MAFDTKFNPYVSMITKPTGENEIQAASNGMLDFFKLRDQNRVNDVKIENIEAKQRDDKKLAKFGASNMTLGAFTRENGNFETDAGISGAHQIRMDRAKQRLLEKKVDSPRQVRTTDPEPAPAYNPSAFKIGKKEESAPSVSPAKTVTVYKGSEPVTYTIEE